METRRDIFQAIADPTRRGILALIAFQAMTPSAIAGHFECSRQAVSKHIQILCECEAVTQDQKGRQFYYQLDPKRMMEIAEYIEPFLKLWDERTGRLDGIMQNTNRSNGK